MREGEDNGDRKTEPNDFGAITIHPIAHKAIFFLKKANSNFVGQLIKCCLSRLWHRTKFTDLLCLPFTTPLYL